MREPSVRHLDPKLRSVAVEVDRRLRGAGKQAWIVGGAVRDLALGRVVEDLDGTTDARPEEIEALFEQTHAVGRAFGTIVVVVEGTSVELTTFRRESGYRDARHPDRVEYADSAAEDAERRDFTVNALYLDIARDEVFDPTGGLDDLRAGRLRAVGVPALRFAEDGLRIVRLARFAATLGFEMDPLTFQAARGELASLRGVSPERVLSEWVRGFEQNAGARLVRGLRDLGALESCLPGVTELAGSEASLIERVDRLLGVEGELSLPLGMALLLAPPDPDVCDASLAVLTGLRPSRDLVRAVGDLWALDARLEQALDSKERPRSELIRMKRKPRLAQALVGRRSRLRTAGLPTAGLDQLEGELDGLLPADVAEEPWIGAEDLREVGVLPGPDFGALLAEAETVQLDRAVEDREAALSWLRERAAQLGGNQRPSV